MSRYSENPFKRAQGPKPRPRSRPQSEPASEPESVPELETRPRSQEIESTLESESALALDLEFEGFDSSLALSRIEEFADELSLVLSSYNGERLEFLYPDLQTGDWKMLQEIAALPRGLKHFADLFTAPFRNCWKASGDPLTDADWALLRSFTNSRGTLSKILNWFERFY